LNAAIIDNIRFNANYHIIYMRGLGVFLKCCCMDNLFFKPHELAPRDRKEKTGNYL
jgi:hypothetical protein